MRERIPDALDGVRIDRVVALLTGLPRSTVAEMVEGGAVQLSGRTVTTRSTRVRSGGEVDVDVPPTAATSAIPAPEVDVDLLYADADVIVVDKAPGMVVHPGAGNSRGTLVQGLLARYPELGGVGQPGRPGVVHRLDKGTSGLLVVARSARAYASLVAQLGRRTVGRSYLTLVWGCPEPARGLVDAPIGRSRREPTRMTVSSRGREARTGYEVRRCYRSPVDVALVECRLETGRTHQIRVHLAAIGHPVVGDVGYGGRRNASAASDDRDASGHLGCGRPFLHAEQLSFDHPATGDRLSFVSELPGDLREVLAKLS
ncbi:MAG TPA: RluA family pseudouridine synthase [Acidimicrobiales bacterium]|nr:RluA family pseudouridine synthase [Acidimicrobiales bacterium]